MTSGISLMEMLLASRPNWMWKTHASVAAKSSVSTYQGMCTPIGGSGGWRRTATLTTEAADDHARRPGTARDE